MVTLADIFIVFNYFYQALSDPLFLFIVISITIALFYHIKYLMVGYR